MNTNKKEYSNKISEIITKKLSEFLENIEFTMSKYLIKL